MVFVRAAAANNPRTPPEALETLASDDMIDFDYTLSKEQIPG